MIHNILAEIKTLDNWEDVRHHVGELINFDGELPDAVINRVLTDEKFALYLVMTKDSPKLQYQLLYNTTLQTKEEKAPSNTDLLIKASGSLFKWAKAGFTQISEVAYEKRINACHSCPNLKEPAKKAVYLASKLAGGEQSVCGLCGCVAARKAKLPTESCPAQDPVNPSFSRWGEPFK
jgi:hypothetical protein